jgi:streptogramin lyase
MEIDEQLREEGERWRAAERAPVADFERATRSSSRRVRAPGRSRGLLAVPIMVAGFALAFGVVFFVQSNSSSTKVTVTQPTTPTSTAPGLPNVLPIDPAIVQTEAIAIDGASVWVTGDAPQSRAATLEHIDTKTGRVIGKVLLGDNGPFQIVVGDGAVWVCSQQNEESAHLTKIDPTTAKITAVIETAGDAAVAVTTDAVWVDVNSGELLRLDPVTNKVLARITLPGGGYSAHFISATTLGVFLVNNYDGTVLRVNESTNTVKVLADIGNAGGQLVELDGSLWVNAGSSIVQLNPTTGVAVRRVERSTRDLVTDGRWLWASTNGPNVVRFDPRTGTAETVPLPAGVGFAIALAGAPDTGAVWAASDPPSQRLLRVSP